MRLPQAPARLRVPTKAKLPWYYLTEALRDTVTTLDDHRSLRQVRAGRPLCYDPDEANPLVTIRIATYNRGQIVAERALASAVAQTYENIEIVVVGDNCDQESVDAVLSVDDPRITFINLPAQGLYPEIPNFRRKVAGAHPMNIAVALAGGSWIAPCDDDDEMTRDHVQVLLDAARAGPYEMVWSRAEDEVDPGQFKLTGGPDLRRGNVNHGTVLYRSELPLHAIFPHVLEATGTQRLEHVEADAQDRRRDGLRRSGHLPLLPEQRGANAARRCCRGTDSRSWLIWVAPEPDLSEK